VLVVVRLSLMEAVPVASAKSDQIRPVGGDYDYD
jgi:hypothetical protein